MFTCIHLTLPRGLPAQYRVTTMDKQTRPYVKLFSTTGLKVRPIRLWRLVRKNK